MTNIIYSRVSTNSQGPESIEVQNTICLNYLNSNGIVLNNSYSEVTSAYNGKQKVLENIIKNTKNATIYVKNISRLSRNITNGLRFIEEAKKNFKERLKNIRHYLIVLGGLYTWQVKNFGPMQQLSQRENIDFCYLLMVYRSGS